MKATAVYPEDIQPLARAVDTFVSLAFESEGGSFFTPGLPIWSTANLAELKQRFVDQPDETATSFDVKLSKQLDGASDSALQLMAELVYVYHLVAAQMHGKTKIENVNRILRWMKQPVSIPEQWVLAAEHGLGNTGTFYLTNKPFQLWFLIHAVLAWRQQPSADRQSALNDPWAFKAFLLKVPAPRAHPIRMAVLHMVFPETFESIISATHKEQICAAYPTVAPNERDEDRRIQAIKATLPPRAKTIWTFYQQDIRSRWQPDQAAIEKDPDLMMAAGPIPVPSSRGNVPTVDSLASSLYIDPAWLCEVRKVLLERGQIVFHGPPGTGKTMIARALGSSLVPPERLHFVQFHPAYSYEDFIEGLRPKVGGGAGTFEVRPGPLRRIAEAAAAVPNEQHVLIIDELNRANLPRVLGELVFLLEYRGAKVTLPYSGEQFALPKNLLIIGTMNTADRSIALIDAAIRRRFAFFRLAPDCPPVDGVLAEWLDAHAPSMGWLDELVGVANGIIQSPDHAIGPAFFMRAGLNDEILERIWKWQVLPYLDEFLYDAPESRQKLQLAHLRGQLAESLEGSK